jgi:hypothetical protein
VKSGRINRRVRQWSNFALLMMLLSFVGWFAWNTAHQKMIEVPSGWVQVSTKSPGLLFWRDSQITLREHGKYPVVRKEVEAIEAGKMVCIPQTVTTDFEAKVDLSSLTETLKSKLGMGKKSYALLSGALEFPAEQQLFSGSSSGDFKNALVTRVKDSLQGALANEKKALKLEDTDTVANDFSRELKEKLGVSKANVTISSVEYPETATPGVTVSLRDGQFVAPKIIEELPPGSYFAIAAALGFTVLVYGFIRLVFGEVIGLFVVLVASAFGLANARVYEAGHYSTRRPRRSGGVSVTDMQASGPDLSLAGEVVGEVGGLVVDAASSFDSVGDGLDAVGTIFDALGGLSDIF